MELLNTDSKPFERRSSIEDLFDPDDHERKNKFLTSQEIKPEHSRSPGKQSPVAASKVELE
jgi:hypothetical protein